MAMISAMILAIIAILILLWLLGIIVHIGGFFIYLLLVAALIIYILDHIFGRRRL
ncbi:MAG TPA: DUF5670 family protein [Candidatus Saccharimonadales bacterium]|nr:DUF5670 family protein [Candidatus Saccharimonadales bacterium]